MDFVEHVAGLVHCMDQDPHRIGGPGLRIHTPTLPGTSSSYRGVDAALACRGLAYATGVSQLMHTIVVTLTWRTTRAAGFRT